VYPHACTFVVGYEKEQLCDIVTTRNTLSVEAIVIEFIKWLVN